MFASNSRSMFGSQVHGQGDENRNPLNTATPFGSPAPMSNFGGTSPFGVTSSSPLSSTTSGSPLPSSNGFSVFAQKPPVSASSTAGAGFNSFGDFNQHAFSHGGSSSFTTMPNFAFGTCGSGFESHAAAPTFSFKQSVFGGPKQGSKLEVYKKTDDASCEGKLVTISAMPVYKDKSHEELRWEDYQLTVKGGFGFNSAAAQSTSSSFSPSSSSWSTPSFSTKTTPSNCLSASQMTPSNFSCFSSSANTSWATPIASSTSAALSAPVNSPFASTATVTPNNPFGPRATITSQNSSLAPSSSPFTFPSFTNFTATSLSTPSTSVSPTTVNPNPWTNPFTSYSPITPNNPFAPRTTFTSQNSSAPSSSPSTFPSFTNHTGTSLSTSSTPVSPITVNPNPFTNPFTSLASQTPTLTFPGPTSSLNHACSTSTSISPTPVNTSPFSDAPTSWTFPDSSGNPIWSKSTSISPAPVIPSPSANPFTSLAQTPTWTFPGSTSSVNPTSSVSVSPVSFNFNQPSTLFKPHVPSPQNCNGPKTEGGGHTSISQQSTYQNTGSEQPSSAASPFGLLPPRPQIYFDGFQSTGSIQYGISSLPVHDKSPHSRVPPLLTIRHLSRRSKLPVRKYDPKLNGPKVPFFRDNEEIPLPRENPRALVICPEKWPLKDNYTENSNPQKFSSSLCEEGDIKDDTAFNHDDQTKEKDLLVTVPDVLELLPKLQLSEYYTEPQISELEAKERAEPGFCSHVRDFVVGRHGYGSIKFLGETDVRKLDLEALVQFNNREVLVYMDESKKPPVGEGLNKPAEVTLLNIKCVDKKTGKQYVDGLKIDKYREMVMKKTVEQGAEFVLYDPVGGVWKFKVQHF